MGRENEEIDGTGHSANTHRSMFQTFQSSLFGTLTQLCAYTGGNRAVRPPTQVQDWPVFFGWNSIDVAKLPLWPSKEPPHMSHQSRFVTVWMNMNPYFFFAGDCDGLDRRPVRVREQVWGTCINRTNFVGLYTSGEGGKRSTCLNVNVQGENIATVTNLSVAFRVIVPKRSREMHLVMSCPRV